MKARWIAALTAVLLLVAPASGQILRPGLVAPMGEKKVGQYVWVWRSERLRIRQRAEIEAPCPTGYVVLGGRLSRRSARKLLRRD